MLTHRILQRKETNSITISADFYIKLEDLVKELKPDKETEIKLITPGLIDMKEYLLLNYEIIDVIKCASEIIKFQVYYHGWKIKSKGII